MADKIQLRRGATSLRTAITPSNGEPILDTTTEELFIGDGATAGGIKVNGLADNQADIAVSAVASTTLFSATRFALLARLIAAAAGSGTYSAVYALPITSMWTGAVVEVNIELAASANPTVEIRNATTGGTLLATVTNPAPGAVAYWYARFRFNGTAWVCLFRAFQS